MTHASDPILRYRLAMVIAIAVSFFFNLHALPLFDVDEGAFSEATREMFERGDFISTYLNGVPRYDKPILIYWLQAAAVTVFGVNEFAFRLPSALAATAWVLAVGWFVARLRGAEDGYRAAIVTALSLSVSVIGKAATADALLNLWLVLALLFTFVHYRERRARDLYAAFACIGLGVLTKGPIALLVPGAVGALFFGLRGQWRDALRIAFNPIGLVICVAIFLPWYALQYQAQGQAFIDGFFLKHNVERFSGPMEQHGGSLFYYIPVALFALLPFSGAIPTLAARWRELWRDDFMQFCVLWFGFVFVFFSLSGTKLPHYMNYGITPAAILIALHIDKLRWRPVVLGVPLLVFALLWFIPDALNHAAESAKDPYWQEVIRAMAGEFGVPYRIYVTLATVAVAISIFVRRIPAAPVLVASGIALVVAVSGGVMPALGSALQQPVKEAAALVADRPETVVMWHLNVPSFSVYRQRITPRRRPESGEIVLTKKQYLAELGPSEVLYQGSGVVLAKVTGGWP
jgi:4-amino-4-deoxy-L-arabinose transferase-like glycosyltransferase